MVLGKLIENYMEVPELEESIFLGFASSNPKKEFKEKLESVLQQYNLTYIIGGIISDGRSISSKSLAELIKGRDIPAIEAEFTRAIENVNY